MSVNDITAGLPPYPMEELARTRAELRRRGATIYDFGTGDPQLPLWPPIVEALRAAARPTSQYPSVYGSEALQEAQRGYLQRRLGIDPTDLGILPTSGSKEAIFHTALSLVGREGRQTLAYPDPGYPVYRASALFARGRPYPIRLSARDGYLLEPWDLPERVQNDLCALWINYPHNPTGTCASTTYLYRLIDWARHWGCLILSDDCYLDIYAADRDATLSGPQNPSSDPRPVSPLALAPDCVISFLSLSKRSGLTGYRSGMMVGPSATIAALARARANMGVASPGFVSEAAAVAWSDDTHVAERRRIFTDRMRLMGEAFVRMDLCETVPAATFYLWARVPGYFGGDDIRMFRHLADRGVLSSPSQWLSEGLQGYLRFALVPDIRECEAALDQIAEVLATPVERK